MRGSKSWRLKKYKDHHGEPLELVAADLANMQPLPFTLKAADDATTATLTGALFRWPVRHPVQLRRRRR